MNPEIMCNTLIVIGAICMVLAAAFLIDFDISFSSYEKPQSMSLGDSPGWGPLRFIPFRPLRVAWLSKQLTRALTVAKHRT